jgi:hypothetical protein
MWQDTSEGLPENLQADGFVENDSGTLYHKSLHGLVKSLFEHTSKTTSGMNLMVLQQTFFN